MMIQSFSQLINTDFDIKNITVTPYTFEPFNKVEYKHGRKNNLLHIVTFGTRYYNINGIKFKVDKGNIIFIPKGTKYTTFTKEKCIGTGICFDMIGKSDIILPPNVYTDWQIDSSRVFEYVNRMERLYTTSPTSVLTFKAILFKLVHILATGDQCSKKDYLLIKPAIDYISLHFTENQKISEYASLCNISESYFRKKFVKCIGVSPIEYRNNLRFALARCLYNQGKTLQEIAETTGFYDAGFFSKSYKKQTGDTLKNNFERLV